MKIKRKKKRLPSTQVTKSKETPKPIKIEQVMLEGVMREVNVETGEVIPIKTNPSKHTLFTPFNKPQAEQMIHLLSLGKPLSKALETVGINKATFITWKKNNPDFVSSIMDAREQRADAIHEEYYEKDIRQIMDSDLMAYDKDEMDVVLKRQKVIHGHLKMDAPRKYNPQTFDSLQFSQTVNNTGITIDIPDKLFQSLKEDFTPKKSEAGIVVLPPDKIKEVKGPAKND